MKTISEMYKLSGGATIGRKCEECTRYKIVKGKRSTQTFCTFHDGLVGEDFPLWKGRFIACKFFTTTQEKSSKRKRNPKRGKANGMD